MTKQEFFDKAIKFGIDIANFDYSLLPDKIISKQQIKIKCIKHNLWFTQLVQNHLRNNCGCKLCSLEKQSKSRVKTTEHFIQDARKIWNNKYDYSISKYTFADSLIKIRCIKHNHIFTQNANQHLRGHEGCEYCKSENRSKFQLKTTEQFIQNANNVWDKINKKFGTNYLYDYTKVNYIGNQNIIIIKCLKHNIEFSQNPHGHLQGHCGCPKCKEPYQTSKIEKELLNFIKLETNIFENIHIIENYRDSINKQELDIYIPELKIGIEFDGLYWHSEEFKSPKYHIEKTNYFENQGIQVIHIFENEWLNQRKIVESRLRQILNKTKFVIPARKCKVKQVSNEVTKIFLQNNHLQGSINSTINYGLYYTNPENNKEYLVSIMTFGTLRKNLGQQQIDGYYELYRFCNACNFRVIGGASKLFKHFIKIYKPIEIISYANRRYTTSIKPTVYDNIGMKFDSYTEPNYFYIDGDILHNRFAFRKDILITKYGCKPEMTEREFMQDIMQMPRIYDCGNIKYIWNNSKH